MGAIGQDERRRTNEGRSHRAFSRSDAAAQAILPCLAPRLSPDCESIHLAAPYYREYPYEPPGWLPEFRDGILAEPIRVAPDGTVAVPDAPGLGIELDEDKLSHYAEKYFEITSRGIAVKTIREKGLFTALRLARKRKR